LRLRDVVSCHRHLKSYRENLNVTTPTKGPSFMKNVFLTGHGVKVSLRPLTADGKAGLDVVILGEKIIMLD
jgi:hypothetical protein